MSRRVTLPNALKAERITRTRPDAAGEPLDFARPIEGSPYIDVSAARAIYALGCEVHIEISDARSFCFTMATETDAAAGVETLARIGALA